MSALDLIVQTSRTTAATTSRLEKTRTLAACVRAVDPADIAIAIAYLSGETRQGKLGVSCAALHDAQVAPAAEPALTLEEVDRAGVTDETLRWQTEEFQRRETHRDGWTVYLRPEIVVEIAFNEIQQSSQYPGGLALRFARVKGYRPDKRPDEADTMDAVRTLYNAQVHAQPAI